MLGRTGLAVSPVGFGAWAIGGNRFGNSYGPTDDAESLRAAYPHFDDFLAVRDKVDPARVFANSYTRQVLGN